MLKSSVRSFLDKLKPEPELLVEGLWADQYSLAAQAKIKQDYDRRWCRLPNPETNPELYDPLQPPQGWRYDPYYELWINTGDAK